MIQLTYDFPTFIFPLQFTLPVVLYTGGNISNVDWGDYESSSPPPYTHNYSSEPTTPIIVTGHDLWINNYNGGIINAAAKYLISCEDFTSAVWLRQAFKGCIKLINVPSSIPAAAIDLREMFRGAINFNQSIGGWDVSHVENMGSMFNDAIKFNRYIGGWTVSNVTNMNGMFRGAIKFNQSIGGWDVSQVENMSSMFRDASSFNQDISLWDVSQVTDMSYMFQNATSFNQDISLWPVSQVGYMNEMFRNASSFNQDIGGWTVSQVVSMDTMFRDATSFNQDISLWDISHVTNMNNMFNGASSFNQNIGGWHFNSVASMIGMFDDSGLTITTYDEMLTSLRKNDTILNNLTVLSTGITIGVKGLFYSNKSAHDFLESQNIFFEGDTYIPPTPTSNICFIKDTIIQTDQGKFPIQSLTKQTIHRMPITLTKTIHSDPYLVKIAANAFGAYPTKDTYMSLKHKVYLGKPIQAKHLINDDTVTLVPYNGETLYNVLLDKHTTMSVHGMLVETLDPNCPIALFFKSKLSPKQKMTRLLSLTKKLKNIVYS